MNHTNKNILLNSFEKIARSEGISTEEVRHNIALAISHALKSNDPKVQHFWKDIPCEGEAPTIEEITNYIATQFADINK